MKDYTEQQLSIQKNKLLETYTNWLWYQHNDLTNSDNNKVALEEFCFLNKI